jgi:putative GTP pyrophosphokinase
MPSKKYEIDFVSLRNEYDAIKIDAFGFCDELIRQLEKILREDNIYLGFPIESRIKTWESIEEKLKRVPIKIKSLTDLQDIIGIRFILLFKRDVEQVRRLITNNLIIVKEDNTFNRLSEDQFGYSSFHLIIRLPEKWLELPSLAHYDKFMAEIQIRSIAQHLWAAASHTLQYKVEANVPKPVRRSIYRVSALLEMVDLEFDRVLDDREKYRNLLTTEKIKSLDADSLEIILNNILPLKNKSTNENYSELIIELNGVGISTPEQLEDILKENLDALMAHDNEIVQKKKKNMIFLDKEEESRVMNEGVFYSHTGLLRNALDNNYGIEWKKIFIDKHI